MSNSDSLRIAVLSGGKSPEREISLASGICVSAALEEVGHRVRGIDPAEVDLVDIDWRQFDAAFVALHGGAGEDGRVQRVLSSLRVIYTGSDPSASQLAMSKSASKERLLSVGVPTPEFVLLHISQSIREMMADIEPIGYPLIVKPDSQGSSLGVSLAAGADDFQRAVAESQFYDRFVLGERYVSGREFTVAVLDRRPLPLLEIVADQSLLDYDAKYRSETTEYLFDPDLPAAKVRQIETLAVAAVEAIGTAGLVRVDLRLDEDCRPWVLEVNTIPGMTERSLAPRAAAQAGIEMPTLCDLLVRQSLASGVAS